MLLSLLALSILLIPFSLTEAAWRTPVLDTHAQYGLNLTFAWWLKSGTVRFRSPEEAASKAHTRQIWPKEARFCEAAYRTPERVWGPLEYTFTLIKPRLHDQSVTAVRERRCLQTFARSTHQCCIDATLIIINYYIDIRFPLYKYKISNI